jgi:hypothetical protein
VKKKFIQTLETLIHLVKETTAGGKSQDNERRQEEERQGQRVQIQEDGFVWR